MKRSIGFVFFLLVVISTGSMAADINFKGYAQPWFSYAEPAVDGGDANYGFTLRRIRFTPYGSLAKNINWTLQVGWDKFSAKVVDAFLDFNLSKEVNFRIGHYSVPGAVSGSLTSSSKLDMLERSQVTEKWSDNSGLTSFRCLGVQMDGKLANGKLYYAVMFANPNGSSIFNPSVKESKYSHANNGPMAWGRIETFLVDGLRIGAFCGGGKEVDTKMKRSSYGAHLYFVKKGINFKVEYIGGKYGVNNANTKYNGMFALLGYTLKKVEPIVMFDFYTPNDGGADKEKVEKYKNLTLGINYFHSKNIKFQANYVIRDESMAAGFEKLKNNLFYMCLQYSF